MTRRCLGCLNPATPHNAHRSAPGCCGVCGRAFDSAPTTDDLVRLNAQVQRQSDDLAEAVTCLDHPGPNVRRHAEKRIPGLRAELQSLRALAVELADRVGVASPP